MNCFECKDLISTYLDNELDELLAADVRNHLAVCDSCSHVCEDLASILSVCSSDPSVDVVPPNSRALWCRINNMIEAERPAATATNKKNEARSFRHLSIGQAIAALFGIAILSSFVTVVVIRSYEVPAGDDLITRNAATQTTMEKVMIKLGLMESPQEARERRMKEQQAAIDYWNVRVQARRIQWDRTTREAFDRNLRVIDETVHEYSMILQKNPEDELSGEMLDSVLNDKMKLLRDFAQL